MCKKYYILLLKILNYVRMIICPFKIFEILIELKCAKAGKKFLIRTTWPHPETSLSLVDVPSDVVFSFYYIYISGKFHKEFEAFW